MDRITLKKALETNQLETFIQQAEASGIGDADEQKVMTVLAEIIKPHQSEDQTSRSACGDDLSEK